MQSGRYNNPTLLFALLQQYIAPVLNPSSCDRVLFEQTTSVLQEYCLCGRSIAFRRALGMPPIIQH
jgi:hypothetical protein